MSSPSSQLAANCESFLISIDPGSTSVGIALWVNGKLRKTALIRYTGGKTVCHRTIMICEKAERAIDQMLISASDDAKVLCVIELPGKQGGRNFVKQLMGLGIGIGALNLMLTRRGYEMHYVDVTRWSRLAGGVCKSKEDRAKVIASMYPEYDARADNKLDIADAVGVGAYHLGHFEGRLHEIDKILPHKAPKRPRRKPRADIDIGAEPPKRKIRKRIIAAKKR